MYYQSDGHDLHRRKDVSATEPPLLAMSLVQSEYKSQSLAAAELS